MKCLDPIFTVAAEVESQLGADVTCSPRNLSVPLVIRGEGSSCFPGPLYFRMNHIFRTFKCKLMLFRCTIGMCLNTACVYLLAFLKLFQFGLQKRLSFTFPCIFLMCLGISPYLWRREASRSVTSADICV